MFWSMLHELFRMPNDKIEAIDDTCNSGYLTLL